MATTVTPATLTVTVVESVSLDDADYGRTNAITISSVTEVYTRLVSVPVTQISLVTFGAAVGEGTAIPATTKYLRITNLDGANYVELVLNGASNNSCAFKLNPGHSFLLHDAVGVIDANDSAEITSASFVDMSSIKAKANSNIVDVEIFTAGI